MPPIPVHIDDPITPQKAQGVTPQTADAQAASPLGATTTTTGQQTSTYQPARPGAAAVPAPTPYAPAPVPQPTRTTASNQYDGPPPPQPGAVPALPSQQASAPVTSTLPPPPKAGEVAQRQATAAAVTTAPPPQMGIPPPSQNYAPTHSTSTAAANPPGPTTLNLGAVIPGPAPLVQPMERPAGYQQDLYAQEMSSAQRARLDQQQQQEHTLGSGGSVGGGIAGANPLATNLGLGGSGGGGGGSVVGDGANETVNNVWNAMKGWANTAGQKLAETEEEVWKRINSRS